MCRKGAEMQFFIILLLLGSRVLLTRSRPSRLEETNDSETADMEYEGNDDTAADEYLQTDEEPAMEEAPQKSMRREDVQQESQEQGDERNSEIAADQQAAQNKYIYESISDSKSSSRKGTQHQGITNINTENEKDYLSDKGRSRKSQPIDDSGKIVPNEIYSHSPQIYRPQNDLSINARSVKGNPEYGEMLFKIKPAQNRRQLNNIAEEAGEQSDIPKQYYNNIQSQNRDQKSKNSLNYERDRRHANVEVKLSDSTPTPNVKEEADISNESSENAIIRNIKKLSEQDLEELLNSLPEDKKALLKKIMDKREITKKAGAVDESSNLEGGQPDTSKLQVGYSADSNTESSMTSVSAETNKKPENSYNLSSKSPDNESDSRSSLSKSEIISNVDLKNNEPAIQIESDSSKMGLKNEVNIISDTGEILKNDNKRETSDKDTTNEREPIDESKITDFQSDDFSVNQEDLCSENEDSVDTRQSESKESNARSDTSKREISKKEPLAMQNCVKSLEDSFPTVNSYEDNNLESEMAPLIRVKRTEKDHHIIKRDSSLLSDAKVHYSPEVESDDFENEENSEFEDYGVFDRASNFVRNDKEGKSSKDTLAANGNSQHRYLKLDRRNLELHPTVLFDSQKNDKMSLGSDTDSVISGIEGVDDNLMYRSGIRGKRTHKSSNDMGEKRNLNRTGRTAGPMIDAVPDNSVNMSHYQDDEPFGPPLRNSEEDVNRIKRVRQVKQDPKNDLLDTY